MDTINEEVRSEMEQIAADKMNIRDHLSSVVTRQRERLMQLLYAPMQRIAAQTSQAAHTSEQALGDQPSWDKLLEEVFLSVPYAKYLYIMDRNGLQLSSSMSRDGLIEEHFGRDRADRPYMREALSVANFLDRSRETCYQQWPYLGDHTQAVDFLLCEAYISQNALRPSMCH
jgi:uncharacterized protein with NRDE domain